MVSPDRVADVRAPRERGGLDYAELLGVAVQVCDSSGVGSLNRLVRAHEELLSGGINGGSPRCSAHASPRRLGDDIIRDSGRVLDRFEQVRSLSRREHGHCHSVVVQTFPRVADSSKDAVTPENPLRDVWVKREQLHLRINCELPQLLVLLRGTELAEQRRLFPELRG